MFTGDAPSRLPELLHLCLAPPASLPAWHGAASFHGWLFYTGGVLHNHVLTVMLVLSLSCWLFRSVTLFGQPLWLASVIILLVGRSFIQDTTWSVIFKRWRAALLFHSVILTLCFGEAFRLHWSAALIAGDEVALLAYFVSIVIVFSLIPVFARTFGLHWWEAGLAALPVAVLLAALSLRIDQATEPARPSLFAPSRWSRLMWHIASLELVIVLSVLFASERAMRMVYDRLRNAGVCCDQLGSQVESLACSNERKEFEIRMTMKQFGSDADVVDGHIDHLSKLQRKQVQTDEDTPESQDCDWPSSNLDALECGAPAPASSRSVRSHHTAKLGQDAVKFIKMVSI